MQANEFWQQRTAPQGSTNATRKPTTQEIREATSSTDVDFHVEKVSTKE